MSDILARLIEAGTPAALVADVALELAKAELARMQSRGDGRATGSALRAGVRMMSRNVT